MSKDIKCKYFYLTNALIESIDVFFANKQVIVNFLRITIDKTKMNKIVILISID